jgi:diguanylate cyclase (GGDEF)-like protein
MAALKSVVLFSLRQSYPKSIKGLGDWAAALLIILLATLLLAGREALPEFISIVVAILLLLAGNALFYIGLQRFYDESPSLRLMAGLLFVWGVLLVWFTFFQPHYGARLVLVTSFTAGTAIAGTVLLLRKGQRTFALWFLVTVLLVRAVALLWRMVTALGEDSGRNLFDASTMQVVYVGINSLALLSLTVGLVLLASARLNQELEHLATHDPLTNALTRRALINTCEQELERCRRHDRAMSLLMLDIDHFKRVNDTHGHQMGDCMLLDFVARITPLLRLPDQLGRFGGEEFVLLLPETSLEEAVMVAERIRARVAAPAEGLPPITVSIGVAANRLDDDKIVALLARADKALYQAKEDGRNRIATA